MNSQDCCSETNSSCCGPETSQEIRKNRQIEYDQLKKDYREGKITKREYKIAIRDTKLKYEGIEPPQE